jgi:hypothetical protein
MITQIIIQLQSAKWYNVSEQVEIAKGRYKLPTVKHALGQLKRVAKGDKVYK